MADDGLRSRTDDQWLFEFFTASVRDDSQLRRESRDVRLFLANETLRNQERKRRVHVSGSLESPVELRSDVLPQRPAIGAHDHATANRSVIGKLGPQHKLVVPFGKIFRARR